MKILYMIACMYMFKYVVILIIDTYYYDESKAVIPL